jgi:hypothetical protein
MSEHELTIGEAEAWRAGWARRGAADIAKLRRMAAELRARVCASVPSTLVLLAEAATLEVAADALARMEPPEPMREPTGLEVRGG